MCFITQHSYSNTKQIESMAQVRISAVAVCVVAIATNLCMAVVHLVKFN
jgi:hypothetical protein